MRIAMFTDNFYPELGGIQDSIMASAQALGEAGDEVLIVAPSASARDYAKGGLVAAEPTLGPRVAVRRLASMAVPSSTGQSRLALPWGAAAAVARFRPQVVHSHTFLGAGMAAVTAARRLGVPLLGTNHWAVAGFSLYAPVARAAAGRWASRAVAAYYNRCAWSSAPSQDTLDSMRAHGFRGAAAVVSNPIATGCFHPGDDRAALKREFGLGPAVIVHAGRLGREKQIDALIRAIALLPEAELVLAGHGSARPALEVLARELGVAARVRFVGTLDHTRLARLFRASDVVAIASTSESQGMALLQAMACGLPAVGVRQGPLIQYIPPETGFLAAPGELEAFAAALGRLLDEPPLRARMGAAAAAFASGFGVRPVATTWREIYRRAIDGTAKNGSASCA